MSIHTLIRQHLNNELFLLSSEFGGEDTPRSIFFSVEVKEIIDGAYSAGRNKTKFSNAKALLDSFIDLGEMTVGMDPFNKEQTALMAKVSPVQYGLFDFRAIDPKLGIRIFGGFAEPDCFVALTWNFRESIADDFDSEVERCMKEWSRLFANVGPHQGINLDDYITTNAIAV